MKFSTRVVIALLILLCGSNFALGQTSSVDSTFNAVPSLPLTSGLSHLVQTDGKVIVYGAKTVIDGVATAEIARLNSDGSRDQSFSYGGCALPTVTSARLLPDGKIVVAGNDGVTGKIIRLNTDGSVDPTFVVSFGGIGTQSESFSVEAVQPDGKILATRRSSASGSYLLRVYRFNTNGAEDLSFTPFTVAESFGGTASVRIELLSDGRFYLALNVTNAGGNIGGVSRRNADGSVDSTWQSPSILSAPGLPADVFIYDLAVAPDGGVFAVGRFSIVNGLEKQGFVKLLPAGNVDVGFPAPPTSASRIYILPDGKILVAGSSISRLNSDGTLDNTFTMDPAVGSLRSRFDVDSNQRIVLFAQMAVGIRLIRLLPNGGLDGTFQTSIATYGQVRATAVQADGKVLVAGVFSHIGGVPRSSFARVNSDGSPDPTFDAHSSFDQPPETLLVQPDGKILALGPFTSYDSVTVPGLVRVNADGTRDATFNPTVSSRPFGIALEADGQVLISGDFNQVNGATRTGLARLNADGTLDATFNPLIGNPSITAVVAQADGKIVIGGSFSGVNGFSRSNFARLFSDGSTDQSFAPSGASGGNIILVRQPDGKYLLANSFTIFRYNADGSGDSSFVAPNFSSGENPRIHAIALQPDGGIIVGGGFQTVGSAFRKNLARLLPNGAFDILFLQGGTDGRVRTLSQYSPNKVIVGGEFTLINNVAKAGIARLEVNAARGATPFDFDGDGRADVTVYRPSTGVWYQLFSSGIPYGSPTFGQAGDVPAPADFDGDGKTDLAIFRPSTGTWWYRISSTNQLFAASLGHPADAIPLPSDVDGDGRDDFVVYRPANNTWYWTTIVNFTSSQVFGVPGDVPVIADFDGDGKSDRAIFRPSNGDWWYSASSSFGSLRNFHWGQTGDIPAPADYDADGKTDFAVFRPSDGGWYIFRSSDFQVITTAFGLNGDRPVAADYDGDGKADIAVFRPSNGIWYLLQSTAGIGGVQWGLPTDVAIPNAFQP